MTINGKRERITRYDLVSVGIHQGIHSCEQIIDDIFEAVSGWPAYAEQAGVSLGTSANIGRSHLTHGELSPKNDL